MKTNYIITTLVILVLGLFISGCSTPDGTDTPTTPTDQGSNGETATNNTVPAELGEACNTMSDCGEVVKVGEPKCIGGSSYQTVKIPRCTLNKAGAKICDNKETTERVGNC